jgi:glutamine synthetase
MERRQLEKAGIGVCREPEQALDALEADSVLTAAVGKDLAEEFVRLKRMEWVEYSRHVSAWEVERYLEFF